MFKIITTLLAGQIAERNEQLADRHALPLLRQQIREAGGGLERARRAVAVALAEQHRDEAELMRLRDQLADLEARAVAALEAGKEDLAREAAATIATLEGERDGLAVALAASGRELSRLRALVIESERRLRSLHRGARVATAAERTGGLMRGVVGGSALADLGEAEATLRRLRERQALDQAADIEMTAMLDAGTAEAMSRRLADAGCGAPQRTSTDDVLARLRAKAAASTPQP